MRNIPVRKAVIILILSVLALVCCSQPRPVPPPRRRLWMPRLPKQYNVRPPYPVDYNHPPRQWIKGPTRPEEFALSGPLTEAAPLRGIFRIGPIQNSQKTEPHLTSFFPYQGGKTAQAKRIAAVMPPHQCYVELFCGGASVFFAKPSSRAEVLNDLNRELITLFRAARFHDRELARELSFLLHSRLDFRDYRSQPGLTDIQRAARYFFVLKTAFGGKGGTTSPCFGYGTSGPARLRRSAISAIRQVHRRLDGVVIECLDFEVCLAKYDRPHTLFYADPPYIETAGYSEGFSEAAHHRLAAALRAIKGKFLLSINDHPLARRLYKGLATRPLKVMYSISRDKSLAARSRGELLIANYPLPRAAISEAKV